MLDQTHRAIRGVSTEMRRCVPYIRLRSPATPNCWCHCISKVNAVYLLRASPHSAGSPRRRLAILPTLPKRQSLSSACGTQAMPLSWKPSRTGWGLAVIPRIWRNVDWGSGGFAKAAQGRSRQPKRNGWRAVFDDPEPTRDGNCTGPIRPLRGATS